MSKTRQIVRPHIRLQKIQRDVRRQLGTYKSTYLAKVNGSVRLPNGLFWVHDATGTDANGNTIYGAPRKMPMLPGAAIFPRPNTKVDVVTIQGIDYIARTNSFELERMGVDPHQSNTLDPVVQYKALDWIINLQAFKTPGASSTHIIGSIYKKPDGDYAVFPTTGGYDFVTANIPSTDNQVVVCQWIDTDTNTVTATVSSEESRDTDLKHPDNIATTLALINECVAAAPANHIGVNAWRIYDDSTIGTLDDNNKLADLRGIVGGSSTVGGTGIVESVVAGTNISVDNTDPANPVVAATSSPGGGAPPSICEGRLTLTSGTPITTTDVTAAGTVYWAPHRGNYIGLYNGSAWELLTFSELSISLSGLLPHSIHDMFIYNNSGTPTLELTAWTAGDTGAITGATNATPIVITTSGTAPATGAIVTISGVGGNTAANGTFRVTNLSGTTFSLQTLAANANVAGSGAYTSGGNWYKADYTGTRATAITTQDGISVKTGATTRRLLGTIRITSTAGQTEDSVARRLVSNLYNPAIRPLQVNEGTNSYSYGTAAWRPLNNSLLNRVEIVTCEDRHVTIDAIHNANRVSGNQAGTGIDVDGISTDDSVINGWLATGNASLHAKYRGYQAAGFHYFQQLEVTNGASQTFYGDFGSTYPKTGMSGEILG